MPTPSAGQAMRRYNDTGRRDATTRSGTPISANFAWSRKTVNGFPSLLIEEMIDEERTMTRPSSSRSSVTPPSR